MLDTIAFLAVDSLTNGFVYALLALSLVLVFSVTRVVNIAQGEYVMLGALTLADLSQQRLPSSLYLLTGGLAMVVFFDVWQRRSFTAIFRRAMFGSLYVAALIALTRGAVASHLPLPVMMVLSLAIVVPIGPVIYRLTVQPNPNATTVVLVIVSVGVGMVLQGLGLLLWGPDAIPVEPIAAGGMSFGSIFIAYQSLAILVCAVIAMSGLYLFSEYTLLGKSLLASAMNRRGAQLCGVPVEAAGAASFALAAAFSALSGMLLAPLITANYEMGFMIGLKGFVGAALGGLADYPLAVLGVLVVGGMESFSAYAASAYRDVIVFSLLLPILLWRNTRQPAEVR